MRCTNATLRDDLALGLASRPKVDLLNSGIGGAACEKRACAPASTPFCYQLPAMACDRHVMMVNFELFACELNEQDGRCTRGQDCSGKDAWYIEAWRNAGGLRFSRRPPRERLTRSLIHPPPPPPPSLLGWTSRLPARVVGAFVGRLRIWGSGGEHVVKRLRAPCLNESLPDDLNAFGTPSATCQHRTCAPRRAIEHTETAARNVTPSASNSSLPSYCFQLPLGSCELYLVKRDFRLHPCVLAAVGRRCVVGPACSTLSDPAWKGGNATLPSRRSARKGLLQSRNGSRTRGLT